MSKVNIVESLCAECSTAVLTCGHAIPRTFALVGVGPVVCPTCAEIAEREKAARRAALEEAKQAVQTSPTSIGKEWMRIAANRIDKLLGKP